MTSKSKKNASELFIILNPKSAGGKTASQWKKMEPEIIKNFSEWEVVFTQRQGHATELTRKAIKNGAKKIIAIGGDGTINEVVRGFFHKTGKPLVSGSKAPVLGIISAGSGSDFVRTLEMPKKQSEIIQVLKAGKTKNIDVGMASYISNSGEKEKSTFINIAEVGIGGEVVKKVNDSGKGGSLTYYWHLATTLFQYQNKKVKITIGTGKDKEEQELIINGIIIANGKYFGGGMKIAPGAVLDDGLFDIIILEEMTKVEMILKMGMLRSGEHVKQKGVQVHRASKISVETQENALLEFDGEQLGTTPSSFSILPKAISIIVP